MQKVIEIKNVVQEFNLGKVTVPALRGVNAEVFSGEFVALVGPSGSGKSTLLNIVGGLCHCTSGDVIVNGTNINNLSENSICLFRRKHMGFIFQSFNLLSHLTALENVEMPLIFSGISPNKRKEKCVEMLEKVGLTDRMYHKPNELSGGQQQRVSIARALVNSPSIVLADEPTGNLDSVNSKEIIELMQKMNKNFKMTFIVVTHDMEVASYADRIIHLKDGLILKEQKGGKI